MYEGEEKSSGVFFFSKAELKDEFAFPVDITEEKRNTVVVELAGYVVVELEKPYRGKAPHHVMKYQ